MEPFIAEHYASISYDRRLNNKSIAISDRHTPGAQVALKSSALDTITS